MNKDVKDKWLAALRSGEYKQGTDRLRDDKGNFCCLGVLCELAAREGVVKRAGSSSSAGDYYYDGAWSRLPKSVQAWAGLNESNPSVPWSAVSGDVLDGMARDIDTGPPSLAEINDTGVAGFKAIADIIEEHL